MMREEDENSRVLNELCALIMSIIRSPHLPPLSVYPSSSTSSTVSSTSRRRRTRTLSQVSPGGFASLLLGISLALMLCGSVTFVIGLILMPWVLGFIMVLYLVGIVSNISSLGRAIICPVLSPPQPPPPPRKEIPGEGFRHSIFGIFPVIPF